MWLAGAGPKPRNISPLSLGHVRKSYLCATVVIEVSILIPICSEKRRSGNHFACVLTSRTVGRGRGRLSLRTRVGLASAGWAVAFSLLAVVSATPRGPTAILSVDDAAPTIGQVVYFDASASVSHDNGNGRIVSYEFDFGDGNRTREQASPLASHSYSLAGPRRASVTVEDARGNEGTASVRIEVQPKPSTGGIPDLTPASASTIPTEPIDGQIAILSITIANHGNGTADAAMIDVMDQRPNGTILAIGNASLPTQLAPEDSVVVYSPTFVAAGVGNHSLQIVVGDVTPAEKDVEDNTLTIRMTVLPVVGPPPGGTPDLAPDAASTIPTQPVEGETVILAITIVNRGTVAAEAAIIDASDVRPNGTAVRIGTTVLTSQLEPGASVVVYAPTFVAAAAGSHALQITIRSVSPPETDVADNALTIPMTVLPAMGPPPPPIGGGVETAIIAGGLAAAAVAALLVATWLLLTPREPGPLEPPPPEPPDDSPPPIRPP